MSRLKPAVPSWAAAPIVVKPDPPPPATGSPAPSIVAAKVPHDPPGESRRYQLAPAQEARQPLKGPEPLPGAL